MDASSLGERIALTHAGMSSVPHANPRGARGAASRSRCGSARARLSGAGAVNQDLIGKQWPAVEYEIGREKIREYANAVGETNPIYHDPGRGGGGGARAGGGCALPERRGPAGVLRRLQRPGGRSRGGRPRGRDQSRGDGPPEPG